MYNSSLVNSWDFFCVCVGGGAGDCTQELTQLVTELWHLAH